MAKFAVALLFLIFAGVTLGSEIDELCNAVVAPLDKDIKRSDSLNSKMKDDVKTLEERLVKYKKSMNHTIETEVKEFGTKAAKLMKQHPKKAETIKSRISEIEAEAINHITTVNTCMKKIVTDLKTQYNETVHSLEIASANINRTLTGIKECSKDNDYSTLRCTLRFIVSRKCDYLDGVTEMLDVAASLHTAIELATIRMDNTCEMTKNTSAFRKTTAQAELEIRKMIHSG